MTGLRPQIAVLVALVALVPVGVMTFSGRVSLLTGFALVNVVIIAGSLYYMFGPSEGEGHGHAG